MRLRRVFGWLGTLMCGIGVPAWAEMPATVAGVAHVSSAAARGLRFDVSGRRCDDQWEQLWYAADGTLVAHENVQVSAGRWQQYRLVRPPAAQSFVAERDGSVIRLTSRHGSRQSTQLIRTDSDVLAGPTLIPYLVTHGERLRRGEMTTVQFLVPDQGLVLGLRVQRTVLGADGYWGVKLDAESSWLRPFVPATYFTFDAQDRLMSMQGRLLPLWVRRSGSEPLEGILSLSPSVGMKSVCNTKKLS